MKPFILGMVSALGVIGVILMIVGGVGIALDRHETVECKKWASEAPRFENYYVTSWQYLQCEAHGIIIDAPIK